MATSSTRKDQLDFSADSEPLEKVVTVKSVPAFEIEGNGQAWQENGDDGHQFGFFCPETNTFYSCRSYEEFRSLQAELNRMEVEEEPETDTGREDIWESLFEVF